MVMRSGIRTLLLLLVLATGARAADVSFTATLDPERVPQGRPSILTVTLAADRQDLPDVTLPQLAGADVTPGGTSQQFSMVNGAVSITKTWRWRVHPRGADDVAIPALEVRLDGGTYRTEPLTLTVDAAAASAPAGGGNRAAPPAPAGQDCPAPDMPGPGDDHFVTLESDRARAYVGEQVVLTFRYYQALRARGFDRPEYTAPRTEGFWREELGEPRTYRETRGSVGYQVTEIRYSLTPTRPGDLLVEPARVVIPQDPFQGFFNRRGTGPQELWTTSIALPVLDLPAPRPAGFSGLVSRDVALSVSLDRDTIPQGEAVSATVRIQADGSLKSLTAPAWTLPEGLQVHEAGLHVSSEVRGGRLRGGALDERILQPLVAGTFELPPLELVSFDPRRGEYVTTRSRPLTLTATPSDFRLSVPAETTRGASAPGDELAFVHTISGSPRLPSPPLPERSAWWLLLTLPLLGLAAFRTWLARQDRDRRDPVGRRRREALATARRRLDEASALADPAAALGQAAAAVRGFVADRDGRPTASVGTDEVAAHLQRQLDEARAQEARRLLQLCDGARFGRQDDAARDAPRILADLRALVEAAAKVPENRGRLLGAVVLALALGGLGSNAWAQDPVRLCAEGAQAYTAGDLDTALASYRAAADATQDPDILYNLGNVHARRGELGRAVVAYRRAMRLSPGDADLRRNLSWVRTHAADRDLEAASPSPIKALLTLVARASLDVWAALLALLVWALAAGVAVLWWRGGATPPVRRLLLGLSGTLAVVAVVTAFRWHDERVVDHAVVVAPQVVLRSGPDASFPEVLTVHDGLELRIEDRREDWRQVGLGGDWKGWLPADAVEPIRKDPEGTP